MKGDLRDVVCFWQECEDEFTVEYSSCDRSSGNKWCGHDPPGDVTDGGSKGFAFFHSGFPGFVDFVWEPKGVDIVFFPGSVFRFYKIVRLVFLKASFPDMFEGGVLMKGFRYLG
ncbi:MAG: hypothetical protein ACI8RA_001168 [Chlamydiales bacterium]